MLYILGEGVGWKSIQTLLQGGIPSIFSRHCGSLHVTSRNVGMILLRKSSLRHDPPLQGMILLLMSSLRHDPALQVLSRNVARQFEQSPRE